MQYSQEHLKTMVYAEFGGANRVYYGQLENREWLDQRTHQEISLTRSTERKVKIDELWDFPCIQRNK